MGGLRNIEEIHIHILIILEKHLYFDDMVWVALLFHVHIEEGSRFSMGGPRLLRKYIYFDDLVWVALLFHAHIEEGSRFSVRGPRNIEKIHKL